MKRRNFLKKMLAGLPFLGGLLTLGESATKTADKSGASGGQPKIDKSSYNYVRECLRCHHFCFTKTPESPSGWRFYINGEEVDVSRAVDEHGALHWPFQGAKEGDLCTAKSPYIDGVKSYMQTSM